MTVTATPRVATRPIVHLAPPAGWMNDPHGLITVGGRYHLFFQHLPDSLTHDLGCHWGHATSTDLVHWEHEPVALSPGDGDDGVWSGCAVVPESGQPVLFYSAALEEDTERTLIRTAHPQGEDLVSWSKGGVVASAPAADTAVFRDPVVFRDGDRWRMLVGHGDEDHVAGAAVFSSTDLSAWVYDGLLTTRSADELPFTGTAWECPQLLRRTGELEADVLVVSVWSERTPHHVAACTGLYAEGRFVPGEWQRLTAGEGHYAASHFTDVAGRPCLIFWIRGIAQTGAWAGALSVPYLVSNEGERVVLTPHPAVADARATSGGQPAVALDVEWTPRGQSVLRLVGSGGVAAELSYGGGELVVSVPGARPVAVDHDASMIRVLADGPVLEVVATGGLVGLPLTQSTGGLAPQAAENDRLAWWHLT